MSAKSNYTDAEELPKTEMSHPPAGSRKDPDKYYKLKGTLNLWECIGIYIIDLNMWINRKSLQVFTSSSWFILLFLLLLLLIFASSI